MSKVKKVYETFDEAFKDEDFGEGIDDNVGDDNKLDTDIDGDDNKDLDNKDGDDDNGLDKKDDSDDSKDTDDDVDNKSDDDGVDDKDDKKADADTDYQPNYKFKVKDKEYEIDDIFKDVIKDADSEKLVKDLYTKSLGIDEIKQARDYLKEENTTIKTNFQELNKKFMPAVELYNKGHKAESMASLYSIDDILEVAEEIKKVSGLDPEQQKIYETNFKNNLNSYHSNNELEETRKMLLAERQKATASKVDFLLENDPSVKDVRDWYDEKMGAGSFRKEIFDTGAKNYENKNLLEPEECVKLVTEKLSKLRPASQQGLNPKPGKANPGNNQQNRSRNDRIPTAHSRGSVAGSKPLHKRPTKEQTFSEAYKLLEEQELD